MNIYEWPALYEPTLGENAKKYIFISYSHEDTDIVYQDLKILSENGARIWYDKAMHVGQNWVERAQNKINDKNCAAVLFYVSTNSLRSSAFLQELEYAQERVKEDAAFTFMSINVGKVSAFELLKSLDLDEDAFLQILNAFNQRKLFIPRSDNPLDQEHVVKLIDLFEDKEAIDLSKCQINKTQFFEYANYEQGLQIVKYRGSDSIVTVPATANGRKVLAIGINAFRNNLAIKKVNIPEGIKVLDDFSFSGCTSLETVSLPNSLMRLGYEAFRECYSLTEIVIPYNVGKIGDYCFYKCHNLANIVVLSSVPLSIEFAAFSECHAMETFILPETTTHVGPYAFNNCINLGSFVLPRNIQQIGLSAFYNCASLSTVKINTQKVLDNNRWFARCRNLKRVIVGAEQQSQYMFNTTWDESRDLLVYKLETPRNIVHDAGVISWDSVDAADFYTILINGESYECKRPFYFIQIAEENYCLTCSVSAHSYDENIMSSDPSPEIEVKSNYKIFEIQEGEDDVILVRYNGTDAVVKIPDNVTVIGDEVFYNHEEIREVRLPDKLVKIGRRAFYHCLNLQKIDFPATLKEISSEAFWGAHIKEMVLPENVKMIGDSCFACCNYLTKLQICSSSMRAGNKAFYRCINLKKVILPNEFPELYNGMFRGCTELDDITLPTGIKTIRSGSISYIMRLQRIIIPQTVTEIEKEAFSNSFGLINIFVDEKNPVYYDQKGVLFKREDNRMVLYPADRRGNEYVIDDSVSGIDDYAFMDAEHLEKITIGANVSRIGSGAFERCPNLCEVIVKGDVDIIERNAFKDCINLDRILLLSAVVPEIQQDIFTNVSANFKIIVPEKYLKNYSRIVEWQKYLYLLRPLKEN
jgi:hypothetical protein